MPQGSVPGRLLSIIYLLTLSNVFPKYGINFNCYADDTRVYLTNQPSSNLPLSSLVECTVKIKSCFLSNVLKLEKFKSTRSKTDSFSLTTDNSSVSPPYGSRVILDRALSLQSHINNLARSAYFHLRLWNSLPEISPHFHSSNPHSKPICLGLLSLHESVAF